MEAKGDFPPFHASASTVTAGSRLLWLCGAIISKVLVGNLSCPYAYHIFFTGLTCCPNIERHFAQLVSIFCGMHPPLPAWPVFWLVDLAGRKEK